MITTDIDYPAGLPAPLLGERSVSHVSPFMRTTMASGRARQRRTFTSVPSMQSVSFIMSSVQATAFEAWFRDAIQDGAEWFNCRLKTPLGLNEYVCRFADIYQGPTPLGPTLWRIAATLEIFERPLMPPGWGQFPDLILGSNLIDLALNKYWPEADQ